MTFPDIRTFQYDVKSSDGYGIRFICSDDEVFFDTHHILGRGICFGFVDGLSFAYKLSGEVWAAIEGESQENLWKVVTAVLYEFKTEEKLYKLQETRNGQNVARVNEVIAFKS